MSTKKSLAEERVKLSTATIKRKLSWDTHKLISSRIANYDPEDHAGREAEARRLLEIVNSSATEELIVERVKNLD